MATRTQQSGSKQASHGGRLSVHRDTISCQPASRDSNASMDSSDSSVFMYIEKELGAYLPRKDGDVRHCLFRLARWLKAIKEWGPDDRREYCGVLKRWCDLAATNGVDVSLEEIQYEMGTIWPKVVFAAGDDIVGGCWAAVNAAGYRPPKCADWYTSGKIKRMISLCHELQRVNGDRPFFLTLEAAAHLLGTSPEQAGRWFRMLRRDSPEYRDRQVLQAVELHGFGERKVNKYRFVGKA
jgi:hypothetical protein